MNSLLHFLRTLFRPRRLARLVSRLPFQYRYLSWEAHPEYRQQVLDTFASELQRHSDPNAAQFLKLLAARSSKLDEGSAPACVALLAHHDDLVRFLAACTLGVLPHPSEVSVAALIAALNDSEEYVRRCAAYALCAIQDLAGLSAVVAGAAHGHGVRSFAAQLIGELGPSAAPAIPALFSLLHYSEINWRSHWAAIEALARIGPAAVPALREALSDPDPEVRRFADIALREGPEIARIANNRSHR